MRAAADAEHCVHELLHLGARLAALPSGTGGLSELETRVGSRLDTMASTTEATVATGLAALSERAAMLFAADDGEMAVALRTWRIELDQHLGEMFDPEHKRSLVAGLERSLGELLDAYGRRLMLASDPDLPDSPAGRLLTQVRANTAEVKTELAALTLAIGAERGRTAENERSAVKGLEFEPLVVGALCDIAAPHGDVVEHVGTSNGVKGTKKGDIVVTLCDEETAGGGCYVVEAKNRRLSINAIWRELDQAMANWEATAAIAVFASGDQAPTGLPFWYSGDRGVVVLDREDPDPGPLALACLFARWVVRRRSNPSETSVDVERIASSIERAQRALARVTTIRRYLSTTTKSAGDARSQLDELASDVRDALAELAAEIAR